MVVGAGLVGLACALELRQHGLRVEVLEAERPGAGASTAAAGMLSPLAETLAGGPLAEACLAARDKWRLWAPEIAETSGVSLGYEESGSLFPAFTEDDEHYLERLATAADDRGEAVVSLDTSQIRQEYPELAPNARRGLFVPGEALVDPAAALEALTVLLARSGTLVHMHRPVDRIVPADRSGYRLEGPGWNTHVDKVVIAAGAWTGKIEGLPSWVHPVRGQMIAFSTEGWQLRGSVRSQNLYALRRHDEILCGATVEETGFDNSMTDEASEELVEFSQAILPKLRWKAARRQWAGLRPGTKDGLPVIGRWANRELYFATGHFRNGILLAPWTASAVAAELTGSPAPSSQPPFSPTRFDLGL